MASLALLQIHHNLANITCEGLILRCARLAPTEIEHTREPESHRVRSTAWWP